MDLENSLCVVEGFCSQFDYAFMEFGWLGQTRDAPRTMLAILDEDVLQKISDRAPELTVALLHGYASASSRCL